MVQAKNHDQVRVNVASSTTFAELSELLPVGGYVIWLYRDVWRFRRIYKVAR